MNLEHDERGVKRERIVYIDTAKGVGILLVVYAHIILLTEDFLKINWIIKYIYAFHMPLFFFISGFCCCLKTENLKDSQHLKFKGGGRERKTGF